MALTDYFQERSKQPEPDIQDLQDGLSVSLDSTITVMGRHVQVVHIGDIHEKISNIKWLGLETTAQNFKQCNFAHIMVERMDYYQQSLDDFRAEKISRDDFIDEVKSWYYQFREPKKTEAANALADLAWNSKKNDMGITGVDPGNGIYSFIEYQKAERETKSFFSQGSIFQTEQEMKELGELLVKFKEDRSVDDQALAQNIFNTLKGQKGILFYGAGHGMWAADTDLNAQLKAKGISNAKINIYDARQDYNYYQSLHENILKLAPELKKYGQEQPELIYVRDEGKIYFTPTTPEAMKEDLLKLAADVPENTVSSNDYRPEQPKSR